MNQTPLPHPVREKSGERQQASDRAQPCIGMNQRPSQSPPQELTFSSGTLLVTGIAIEKLRTWFPQVFWVFDQRVGAVRCDAIEYARFVDGLRDRSVPFHDALDQPREVRWKAELTCQLRPEQIAAVDAWMSGGQRGCIVMPTGTGKTEVALRIMQLTKTATLVVAPVRDLMYQWHRRILRSLNYDAGIIGDSPISAVRGKTLADYDIVRIPVHLSDEEQKRYELLAEEVSTYMYEQRQEDSTFSWEDLCSSSSVSGEARRALKAFHAKKAIKDRAEEKLKTLEDLFRLHSRERCIVFAGSNAMARDVSLRFLIPCLLSHCGKKERLDILEAFAAGDYPAIVANQVLDEGVDVPAAKVAIVIGGMSSSRQARQRLGRILRRSGDERAILYEVVCAGTNDEKRSRQRRQHETFKGARRKPGR